MRLTSNQALERLMSTGMRKEQQDNVPPSINEDEGVIEIEPLELEVYEE